MRGGGIRLLGRRLRLGAGAFGDHPDAGILGLLGGGDLLLGREVAQVEQHRFRLTDLGGDVLVAHRLASLALERLDLLRQLADDVLEPLEIVLRGLQPSSASCRRACSPATPAASSSTRRRASGLAWMISPMRP